MTVRRDDLDAAKGAGMLLVITGHSVPPPSVQVLIYGFHMPLFFVVSGLLWRSVVRPAHSARSLLVPYAAAGLVSWALWLLKQAVHRSDEVPWWGPLAGTLYGGNVHGYFVHNTPLWFLPAMFSLLATLWVAGRWLQPAAALGLVAACGLLVLSLARPPGDFPWPFCMAQAWVGGIFFAAGQAWARWEPTPRPWALPAWAAVLAIALIATTANGRVDLYSLQFGNPWLYLCAALAGSAAMITACRWSPLHRPWLLRLGRHSLWILVAHMPVLWLLRAALRGLRMPEHWTVLTVCCALLASGLALWLDHRSSAAGKPGAAAS